MIFGKKGENLVFPVIIFLVLNLMFFAVLLVFVYNSSSNESVYEEAYSKQIALMIDNARPNTSISMDISKLVEISDKNKLNKNDIILINEETNKVVVKLSSKGYSFSYYSDYDIEYKINENTLTLVILEAK